MVRVTLPAAPVRASTVRVTGTVTGPAAPRGHRERPRPGPAQPPAPAGRRSREPHRALPLGQQAVDAGSSRPGQGGGPGGTGGAPGASCGPAAASGPPAADRHQRGGDRPPQLVWGRGRRARRRRVGQPVPACAARGCPGGPAPSRRRGGGPPPRPPSSTGRAVAPAPGPQPVAEQQGLQRGGDRHRLDGALGVGRPGSVRWCWRWVAKRAWPA